MDADASVDGDNAQNATPSRPNLFLKNSSAHLPNRRQQLAVTNNSVPGDVSEPGSAPGGEN